MVIAETWLGVMVLIVLTCAIFGGVVTAFLLIADKSAPVKIDLGLLHGRMGIAGILLLAVTLYIGKETTLSIAPAIIAFMITAVAGAVLYFLIRRKGILSNKVIFMHGAFAVASLGILIFSLPA